jgi:copper chaperone CopZ
MKNVLRFLAPAAMLLALGAIGWFGQTTASEEVESVKSVFSIEGMTCGGCEAGVKMKVKKLEGVKSVDASYEEGRATVTYDPHGTTPEEIVTTIEELGYTAKDISAEAAPADEASP